MMMNGSLTLSLTRSWKTMRPAKERTKKPSQTRKKTYNTGAVWLQVPSYSSTYNLWEHVVIGEMC